MDLNKFFQSKQFNYFIWGLVAIILLLVVFKVGMDIGFKKAKFSCDWGQNYYRNFAGPAKRFPDNNFIRHDDFMEAHGVYGQIIQINESESDLVIKDAEGVEKIVLVQDDTTIKNFNQTIKLSDLKIDDKVVIIGEPNSEGKIEAKLIRVLPSVENSIKWPVPNMRMPPEPFQ